MHYLMSLKQYLFLSLVDKVQSYKSFRVIIGNFMPPNTFLQIFFQQVMSEGEHNESWKNVSFLKLKILSYYTFLR